MNSLKLFIIFIFLFFVIILHRHRVARNMIKRWLDERKFDGPESGVYKQNINVLVWPILATIITNDNEGQRVKIKFEIGTIIGGFFNNKIRCDRIEKLKK